MRTQITDSGVRLWLSANDTYRWATRPCAHWPCSELAGNRLFADFDQGGLIDLAIDGRPGDCPTHELTAIVSDHLRGKLPVGHPCKTYLEPQP